MEEPTRIDPNRDRDLERLLNQRSALKARHTHALTKLLQERADLRGVHALADMVHESLRWSA